MSGRPGKVADRARATWRRPFSIERLGPGLTYVWYGMRFATWMRLLARGRFDVTLNCLPRIATVTLMTALVSASALVGRILFARRVAETEVAPPVFILGHWRTGTTLVHELLALDTAFAYPTTHQCFFPETFLVSGRIFHGIYRLFLPARRPFDDMVFGLDRPQEEEFALVNMGVPSPYDILAFPRHGPPDGRYLDLEGLRPAERKAWEAAYVTFLKRLQFATVKPLVLKSPPNTARVAALLRLFPEARFIHITRHPFEVYASSVHMLKAFTAVQGLHNPPLIDGWVGEYVLTTFERMYAAYERDRPLIPDGRLVEVRYEDLVADAKGVVREIYRALGLGEFAPVAPRVEAYLAERAEHKPKTWVLAADERQAIVKRWRSYFARYGYATESPPG